MAPHLTLQHCVDAAVQALLAGRSLSPLTCRKCKKLHLDEDTWAQKPHAEHLCLECEGRWYVPGPRVQGNPLALFQPSLLDGKLYLATLPHAGGDAHVPPATLTLVAVEPHFLDRVAQAQASPSDSEMRKLRGRAQGEDAEFQVR